VGTPVRPPALATPRVRFRPQRRSRWGTPHTSSDIMSPVGRLHDAVAPQAIPSLLDDDVAHSDRDRDRRARASVEIRQETGGSLSRLDAGALRQATGTAATARVATRSATTQPLTRTFEGKALSQTSEATFSGKSQKRTRACPHPPPSTRPHDPANTAPALTYLFNHDLLPQTVRTMKTSPPRESSYDGRADLGASFHSQ